MDSIRNQLQVWAPIVSDKFGLCSNGFSRFMGAVLVAGGIGIASIWAPDRTVEELIPTLAPAPSQFLEINGMRAHVRDEGPMTDPSPIVLLHGTSSSLHTWDGWTLALKAHRRIIRVDLPGFGLTGPHPSGKYDIETNTQFVIALMDALHVKSAVLAGNSLGGYIAWKTAVDYPDRVTKLVLVDSAGYKFAPKSIPIGFKLANMPLLSPITTNVLPKSIIADSLRNVYGDPSKVTPALIERYYNNTLRAGNRQAVIERFTQTKGGDFELQIQSIKQPTLILWGSEDRLIPIDNAKRFQLDIKGSELVVFTGLGHVPQEEDPAVTVKPVQAFLSFK